MWRSSENQRSKSGDRAVKTPIWRIKEEEEPRIISTDELRVFGEERGMPISQVNGQRVYGPSPFWNRAPPEMGSEVFVGKLPRDVFEPTLVPLFEAVGPLYEMRLMMDFSGTNRGYCFVQYTNREDAERAVMELDGYEILKGRRIGVVKSVDNRRLYFGGIPKKKTVPEIFDEVSKVTHGVKKVWASSCKTPTSIHVAAANNRGFAFVEYFDHKMAAMARKKMISGLVPLWDHTVTVDWAEPDVQLSKASFRGYIPGWGM